MLLVIACVNVAHLQLARAAAACETWRFALHWAPHAQSSCGQMILEALLLSLAGSALAPSLHIRCEGLCPFCARGPPARQRDPPRLVGYRYQLWLMHSWRPSPPAWVPAYFVYRANLYGLMRQDSSRGMGTRGQIEDTWRLLSPKCGHVGRVCP